MNTSQNQEFSNEEMNNRIDENSLWRVAKKRAFFKQSAIIYILVSLFLVTRWYVTPGANNYFWPKWLMLFWGLGVAIQYLTAYHSSQLISKEKEYKKLKMQIDK